MMITGIIASPRKLGNSDILVKEALRAAQELGTKGQILRLYDFNIEFCRGCEKCVVGETKECPIKDDVKFIYQVIDQSDGLILGCPIYIHNIPGILKAFMDRMRPYIVKGESNRKKAMSFLFTHYFDSKYEYIYALPSLLFFSFYFNFRVSTIASIVARAPGDCLLDKQNILKAKELGVKIAQALNKPDDQQATAWENQTGLVCPNCHNLTFCLDEKKIVCPVCKGEGLVSEGNIVWKNKSQSGKLKNWMDYYSHSRQKALIAFKESFREIMGIKEEYRDKKINIPVVKKKRSS